ncbi:MAG: hypothetical protein J7578_05140 [Chitinophagaceae bacterium]|nr:hypothetical protein [Chitinophagaceae bacterium]
MKKFSLLAILSVSLIILIACSRKSSDGETAGVVKGKVVTNDGKPVAGAKVLISSVIWYNSNNVVSTGANGTYSRKLSDITNDAWYAYASIDKEYNGKVYHIDLHPESTEDFLPGQGAVRNFTWKLTGPQVGRSTGVYGGVVTVASEPGVFYDYPNVTLTLIPQGTLIDGSTGATITKKIDNTQKIEVPIGRYEVSAIYAPAGQTPVQMKIRLSDVGSYGTSAIVDFTPETNYCKNCMTLDVKL